MIDRAVFALALWLLPGIAAADPACTEGRFEGVPYTACAADPAVDDIVLYHRDPSGAVIGSFTALSAQLATKGRTLDVAMNGAMYHPDRRPVGLYVEDGVEISPIALRAGPGNFGLLPNGVLCLAEGNAAIVESRKFAAEGRECAYAAQSGPLMVEDGRIHPRFLPDSPSVLIRNGVGVRPDGTVVLAIADAPLNLHRFARLFRDALGTPDALYIDGRVSRFHVPSLGRSDFGLPMGPILGVSRPAG